MQCPAKALPAPDWQEGEHGLGNEHSADHASEHGQEDQRSGYGVQDTDGSIVSFQKREAPFPVQDVMDDKKKKHPHANPFVGGMANQFKSHKQ